MSKLISTYLTKKNIADFLFINLAIIIIAFGTVMFKNPNHFVFGGITGLALVLNEVTRLSFGLILTVCNTILLAIGYLFLGKSFGIKTIYVSYMLSFVMGIMAHYIKLDSPLTSQKFMEMLYAVLLPGIGYAMLFYIGASSGGTDIIAKILCKYFPSFKIGSSLLLVDALIAISGGVVFGIEAMLFAIMGVCFKTYMLDIVLENLNIKKVVVIITEKPDIINKFIVETLKRGATISTARGAYTVHEKQVITTVLNRKEALMLQTYLNKIDNDAFITITNSYRIIGKGFNTNL